MLILITACRCLYWLSPEPYADGFYAAEGVIERPDQLEYG